MRTPSRLRAAPQPPVAAVASTAARTAATTSGTPGSGAAAGAEPSSDAGDSTPASAPESAGTTEPATVHAVGELPAGDPFTPAGAGTYRVVPGNGQQFGTSPDVRTYTVEIEDGVAPAGGDGAFAAFVDRRCPTRGAGPSVMDVSLRRIDGTSGEQPSFRITLTSQLTVRGICGFDVQIESSCFSSPYDRVVLNDARWVRGAYSYDADLAAYRTYAVNHEVGHALGSGHEPCGTDGALAPVMMQQTWSTSDNELNSINGSVPADGKTCQPNPWPNPQALPPAAAGQSSVQPAG